MASGQIFGLTPSPPGQKFAVEETLAATTTATGGPYEVMPVWSFDAATAAYMDLYFNAAGYGGGGFSGAYGVVCTTTATTVARFGFAIRNIDDIDFDSTSGTYTFTEQNIALPGTVGTLKMTSYTATDPSMSNLSAGILRIYRNATATADTLTVNAYMLQGYLVLYET